jgi:iron complex outermembrane receptor protein
MTRFAPVVFAWALAPLTAFAQTPAPAPQSTTPPADGASAARSGEDTVIVTARKREEEVIDVPAAVTSLSAQAIEERGGIRDIGDLAAMAPGVQFTETGNINAEFNIRGSGAGTVRTANTDSPIAVLRDGGSVVVGNIGGRGFAKTDLFDLQRIEVIRGPQGVLYGQSSTGGVIDAISKRPNHSWGGQLSGYYNGTVDERGLDGILNVPLGDKLAMRGGFQTVDRRGGNFYNVFNGKYGDINKYRGGRLSFLYEPTDDLTMFLVYDAGDEIGPSNRVKSVPVVNGVPTGDPDGPYQYGHNTRDNTDRETQSSTLNIDWTVPFADLTSTTTWRSRETTFLQDEDGSFPGYARAPTGGVQCQTTRACETLFGDDAELWAQEFRADWKMPDRWTLMTGVNVEIRNDNLYTISSGRTTSATNLNPAPAGNFNAVAYLFEQFYGAFAALGYEVNDKLDLTVGGRYTKLHKKAETFQVFRNVGGVAAGAVCEFELVNDNAVFPANCRRPAFNDAFNDDNFSPAVSAIYKLDNGQRLFANVARGFRAGGFNANSATINADRFPGDPLIDPSYGNEISMSYEVGAKGRLFDGLYSASLYFNQTDDLLLTLNYTGVSGLARNYRSNAAAADMKGVDLEYFGVVREVQGIGGRFNYSVSLNWFDGEFTEGPYSGRKVEGQPDWQTTFSGTWRKHVWTDTDFFLSANYRAQRGGLTATSGNTNNSPLDNVDNVSLRTGFETTGWRLSLEATNLLDKEYPVLRDPNRWVYSDPRQVRATFAWKFGSQR